MNNSKIFIGSIVSGDVTERTITIKCVNGAGGAEMGLPVLVIPRHLFTAELLGISENDLFVEAFKLDESNHDSKST